MKMLWDVRETTQVLRHDVWHLGSSHTSAAMIIILQQAGDTVGFRDLCRVTNHPGLPGVPGIWDFQI